MNPFQALRRLQAWKEGRPLPRGDTLHFPIADNEDILVVALIRMGGESAPWGIAWGSPGRKPEIRTVPEPRDRDAVAAMVAEFGPALLAHLLHPQQSDIDVTGPKEPRPLRQLCFPNPSHIEMLHHLAYAYTFTTWGDPARALLLNAIGRAAGWLFRESRRPGQISVMAGTDALRESFTFPAEDSRQGHLGYLLAWLETKGGRARRLEAAMAAETRSISTTLEPAIERDTLQALVDAFGEARRAGLVVDQSAKALEITAVLEPELRHRFELTGRAIERLRSDSRRPNAGINELIRDSNAEHWENYLRIERQILVQPPGTVFVPSPETDRHPPEAAKGYFWLQHWEDRYRALILDDDLEMQAEAVAAGEAIRGKITSVRDDGTGRKSVPIWVVTVEGEPPTKLRVDSGVSVAGLRQRNGKIKGIQPLPGKMIVTVEITGLKTIPRKGGGTVVPASDRSLIGTSVTLLPAIAEGIQILKIKKVWQKGTPGSWLAHSKPAGKKASIPVDVAGPDSGPDDSGGTKP